MKMKLLLACASAMISINGTYAQDKLLTFEDGEKKLYELAQKARVKAAKMTFEQFKNSSAVFKEPFDGGKFIVNGDTPISTEDGLRDFFEQIVEEALLAQPSGRLAVIPGASGTWNDTDKKALSYCVSNSFDARKPEVVAAMDVATAAWEEPADIKFVYNSSQDANCTENNAQVVFDIRPVSYGGYLARAFFPNEPREQRNVLIDSSAFGVSGKLTLAGIMRHELGHTIGMRHEQTRPEAGTCYEDANWIGVTDYDPFSVMHYPQCNGQGDWSLTLTELDKNGAACVYGSADGFTPNPNICEKIAAIRAE